MASRFALLTIPFLFLVTACGTEGPASGSCPEDHVVTIPEEVPDETPLLIEVCGGDTNCVGACVTVDYSRDMSGGERWFFCDCETWTIYW